MPASGSLLLAPTAPSLNRFFIPGEHFIAFNSIEDAINKAEYYLSHSSEREKIALNGYEKAKSLIISKYYWISVDIGLGKYSLK